MTYLLFRAPFQRNTLTTNVTIILSAMRCSSVVVCSICKGLLDYSSLMVDYLLTTGVTNVMVCTILSVGWCI